MNSKLEGCDDESRCFGFRKSIPFRKVIWLVLYLALLWPSIGPCLLLRLIFALLVFAAFSPIPVKQREFVELRVVAGNRRRISAARLNCRSRDRI